MTIRQTIQMLLEYSECRHAIDIVDAIACDDYTVDLPPRTRFQSRKPFSSRSISVCSKCTPAMSWTWFSRILLRGANQYFRPEYDHLKRLRSAQLITVLKEKNTFDGIDCFNVSMVREVECIHTRGGNVSAVAFNFWLRLIETLPIWNSSTWSMEL